MSLFQRRTKDAYFNQCKRFGRGRLDYDLADLRLLAADAIRLGPCPYCRSQLTDKSFSFDHATPICPGGGPKFNVFLGPRIGPSRLPRFSQRFVVTRLVTGERQTENL